MWVQYNALKHHQTSGASPPETVVFVPPSPFYNNGWCARELQALVAPKPPRGVLVRGHAGLIINELSRAGIPSHAPLEDHPFAYRRELSALEGWIFEI